MNFCFLSFYLCFFWSGCLTSLGCKEEKYTLQFSCGQVISQNQEAWKCFWVCPVSHGTLWHCLIQMINLPHPWFRPLGQDLRQSCMVFAILQSHKPYADLWALSKILRGVNCPVQKWMGKKTGKPHEAFHKHCCYTEHTEVNVRWI